MQMLDSRTQKTAERNTSVVTLPTLVEDDLFPSTEVSQGLFQRSPVKRLQGLHRVT